jgi:tyrosyl-tRNA synthetase
MKDLAALGHRIVILLGDFTSRVGDPTDKAAARTAQTPEQVAHHMRTYQPQIEKIMPPGSYTVRRNSEWLDMMTFGEVTNLAANVTVQQMLARDMFQERMQQEKPIYLSEFLYPLMQGYDSVAMEIDGEVGGSDQTFNMLVGRDLERALLGKDKMVLPVRLLVNPSTGKKVSKSEGGFIALDDEPDVIFEKVSRSIPDDMVRVVFELATDLPLETIDEKFTSVNRGGEARALNLDLAETLVRMYYDATTATQARERYEAIVRGEVTDELPSVTIGDSGAPMVQVVALAFDVSRSEAKRLIDQGGVSRNGTVITDALGPSDVADGDTLRIGTRRPVRLVVE